MTWLVYLFVAALAAVLLIILERLRLRKPPQKPKNVTLPRDAVRFDAEGLTASRSIQHLFRTLVETLGLAEAYVRQVLGPLGPPEAVALVERLTYGPPPVVPPRTTQTGFGPLALPCMLYGSFAGRVPPPLPPPERLPLGVERLVLCMEVT